MKTSVDKILDAIQESASNTQTQAMEEFSKTDRLSGWNLEDLYQYLCFWEESQLDAELLRQMITLSIKSLRLWLPKSNYVFEELVDLQNRLNRGSTTKQSTELQKIKQDFENAIYSFLFVGI